MRYLVFSIFMLLCFCAGASVNHMVVVDAGSTGTRIHLYEYNLDKQQKSIEIQQIWSNKISPGLSQLQNNKATIESYLTLLTRDLPDKNAPIYFYATAGMRLVPMNDQKKYYESIQQWFESQYPGVLADIKTISGLDEGVYDWLSVNQQLGVLNKEINQQVGVLDLGGASVQIVFPTSQEQSNKTVLLFNEPIYLNTHSFLGLGQTEVQHQLMENSSCYAQKYPMVNGELADGNAWQCIKSLNALVNDVHQVNTIMQSAFTPQSPSRWFVMGSITYTSRAEALHYDPNNLTAKSLLETADSSICHQNWQNLQSQYSTDPGLESYCLYPSYYYALIVNGFGIQAEQVLEQLSKNNDWTRGVVIAEGAKGIT